MDPVALSALATAVVTFLLVVVTAWLVRVSWRQWHTAQRNLGLQSYAAAVAQLLSIKSRFAARPQVFEEQAQRAPELRAAIPPDMSTESFLMFAGAMWQFSFVYSVFSRADELGLSVAEKTGLKEEIKLWLQGVPAFESVYRRHTSVFKAHNPEFLEFLRTEVYPPLARIRVEEGEASGNAFGRNASYYDRARPDYPTALVAELLPRDARLVIDLGAGTGKVAKAVRAGNQSCLVIAVEPDYDMAAYLPPGVLHLRSRAEELNLPDNTADAVIVGTAWRWLNSPKTLNCVEAVLRHGGRFIILEHLYDDRTPWLWEVCELYKPTARWTAWQHAGPPVDPGQAFRAVVPHYRRLDYEQPANVDTLIARVLSSSQLNDWPQERVDSLVDAVRELAPADMQSIPCRVLSWTWEKRDARRGRFWLR